MLERDLEPQNMDEMVSVSKPTGEPSLESQNQDAGETSIVQHNSRTALDIHLMMRQARIESSARISSSREKVIFPGIPPRSQRARYKEMP